MYVILGSSVLGLIWVSLGFPGGSDGKESTCIAGDLGSIPGLGRSPGEGTGYPLQYSSLENSMSNFHFHFKVAETPDFIYHLFPKICFA